MFKKSVAYLYSAYSEHELMLAWDCEGKKYFNFCPTCGKWVSDAMYNPDMLECVICSPCEKSRKKELMQLGFGTGMRKR